MEMRPISCGGGDGLRGCVFTREPALAQPISLPGPARLSPRWGEGKTEAAGGGWSTFTAEASLGERELRPPPLPSPAAHLHLGLDPGPHDVGLAGELPAEVLVGLLLALLVLQGVVPLGHQLLHLRGGGARAAVQCCASEGPPPGGATGRPPHARTRSHLELMICGVTEV